MLHFLLTKLDPARSKEEFVGCWPAYDVKRSHLFRKNVFNWLTELNRDHVEVEVLNCTFLVILDLFLQYLKTCFRAMVFLTLK